jgi:hypothetical protein
MWFIENIQRIKEMVKKIWASAVNIVEGNYGEDANAIERVVAITIPTIISLFMHLLGLGGLPKKVIGVFKRLGAKLNKIIDKVLSKIAKAIRKFAKKKGGGKDGKKDGKNKKKGKIFTFWTKKESF